MDFKGKTKTVARGAFSYISPRDAVQRKENVETTCPQEKGIVGALSPS